VADTGEPLGGDGCSADCSDVEDYFVCLNPDEPCIRCGDGTVTTRYQTTDGINQIQFCARWVDDAGRLLAALAGLEAYILDSFEK